MNMLTDARVPVTLSARTRMCAKCKIPVVNGCVLLASLGRPRYVCGGFIFPGRTCADYYPRLSWGKKPPHTGVDPGKLNERTH